MIRVDIRLRCVFAVPGALGGLYGLWQIVAVVNIYGLRLVLDEGWILLQTKLRSEAIRWGQVRNLVVTERQSLIKSDRPEVAVEVVMMDSSAGSTTIPGYVLTRQDEEALLGYLQRQASAKGKRITMPSRRRETHTP